MALRLHIGRSGLVWRTSPLRPTPEGDGNTTAQQAGAEAEAAEAAEAAEGARSGYPTGPEADALAMAGGHGWWCCAVARSR